MGYRMGSLRGILVYLFLSYFPALGMVPLSGTLTSLFSGNLTCTTSTPPSEPQMEPY